MPIEPYVVLGSNVVHRNPYLTVREDRFSHRQREGVHYCVELPLAVAVVPVLDDGRVLLIRQYRHCVGQILLELPAGRVDRGEEPAAAAPRELREETGYTATSWRPLGRFFPVAGLSDHEGYLFEATGLVPGPDEPDAFEEIELVPHTPAELLAALRDGTIRDGFCQIGLFRWLLARGAVGLPASSGNNV